MKEIPKHGTHMTLSEFIEACETGCFIDYDGVGYYATGSKMSDKTIYPSNVTGNGEELNMETGEIKRVKVEKQIDASFTHVVWFNR